MNSESGKGSNPRPRSVDKQTFDANWDAIFKKNKSKVAESLDKKIENYSKEDSQ